MAQNKAKGRVLVITALFAVTLATIIAIGEIYSK
tara:strand:+ start:226 stop:327 length:102 start_codon:yes stop_codon:yes gene_type:complete